MQKGEKIQKEIEKCFNKLTEYFFSYVAVTKNEVVLGSLQFVGRVSLR